MTIPQQLDRTRAADDTIPIPVLHVVAPAEDLEAKEAAQRADVARRVYAQASRENLRQRLANARHAAHETHADALADAKAATETAMRLVASLRLPTTETTLALHELEVEWDLRIRSADESLQDTLARIDSAAARIEARPMSVEVEYITECHCGADAVKRALLLGQPEDDGVIRIDVGLAVGQSTFECPACGCQHYTGDVDVLCDTEDDCDGPDEDEQDDEDVEGGDAR